MAGIHYLEGVKDGDDYYTKRYLRQMEDEHELDQSLVLVPDPTQEPLHYRMRYRKIAFDDGDGTAFRQSHYHDHNITTTEKPIHVLI